MDVPIHDQDPRLFTMFLILLLAEQILTSF